MVGELSPPEANTLVSEEESELVLRGSKGLNELSGLGTNPLICVEVVSHDASMSRRGGRGRGRGGGGVLSQLLPRIGHRFGGWRPLRDERE